MIRILHSVSYMSRGGIETMLMNYYRHIDRSKIQFDFLCNSYNEGAYDAEIISMGGRIFRSPGFNPLKRWDYKKYMRRLFEEHSEYRIVEAHNGPLGRYAMKAAKDSEIPVRIYHAHGADLPFNLKWPIKYYCMKMLKYSMTEHFVCSEKAGRFYMGDKIMDTGNYHFIPNAIDVEKFVYNPSKREEVRKKYKLNNKLIIGHIGRLSYPKNHLFILNVFAKLRKLNPNVHLVLVGEGELKKEVEKRIVELNLQDAVTLTGVVSNPEVWYQAFDLFFMPSLWEGLPVTGIEAQAADLQCIFSTAITQEVKLLSKTEFLSLDEPAEKWAEVINNKLKDLRLRMDRTLLITEKGYNIQEEAIKLQNLYLELAKKANF